MKLGNNEIALAMELRTEGLPWCRIAYGLSCDEYYLINVVRRAQELGMKPWQKRALDRSPHTNG